MKRIIWLLSLLLLVGKVYAICDNPPTPGFCQYVSDCHIHDYCPPGKTCCITPGPLAHINCYDPVSQICCGGYVLDSATWGCCNDVPYRLTTQCCSPSGVVVSKFSITNLADCPSRKPRPGYTATANGCGADGCVICPPDNPMGDSCSSFAGACTNHDICYGTCNSSPSAKDDCDSAFHNAMDSVCASCYGLGSPLEDLTKDVDCIGLSLSYYVAVHDTPAGMSAWVAAQKAACICCP